MRKAYACTVCVEDDNRIGHLIMYLSICQQNSWESEKYKEKQNGTH